MTFRQAVAFVPIAAFLVNPVIGSTDPFVGCRAVSDLELEAMRGGFVASNGLEITFGISQAVFVDGILQAVTTLNAVPANRTGQQVFVQKNGLTTAPGINIGPGTYALPGVDTDALRTNLMTLVQNSADQKVIDSVTLIDASVSSLTLQRQLNLLYSFQQQLIDSRR